MICRKEKEWNRAMPKKLYHVVLTKEQRKMLSELISAGKAPARALAHARILLKADTGPDGPGWGDSAIAEAVEVSTATVGKVRQRFAQAAQAAQADAGQSLQAALYRSKAKREYRRRLDGRQEAHLVALTCQTPPDGHERWTLRLLAGKMVELEYADEVSYETVRRTLKKTGSSLGA